MVGFYPVSFAVLPDSSSCSLDVGGLKINRTSDNRMMTGTKGRQVSNITDQVSIVGINMIEKGIGSGTEERSLWFMC